MRIVAVVEYDGSEYCGWQRQHHAQSIQQQIEEAVSSVADETIIVHAAGRTDAGVHATGQVVHFDVNRPRDQEAWVRGVNTYLPKSICVLWAGEISDSFHARYCALSRTYRYILLNRPQRSAIFYDKVTCDYRNLHVDAMQQAAQRLLGTHDFTSFRSIACQAQSPVRTIQYISVQRKEDFIFIDITADGFLHHMVRNIVGVLTTIGTKEQPSSWVDYLLTVKDRTQAAVTSPADGLYLIHVQYDSVFVLNNPLRWPVLLLQLSDRA